MTKNLPKIINYMNSENIIKIHLRSRSLILSIPLTAYALHYYCNYGFYSRVVLLEQFLGIINFFYEISLHQGSHQLNDRYLDKITQQTGNPTELWTPIIYKTLHSVLLFMTAIFVSDNFLNFPISYHLKRYIGHIF